MSMYYMCPGGGKRFVPAGSRPRNLCPCTPSVPDAEACLLAGAPLGRGVVLRCSVLQSVLWGVPPSNPRFLSNVLVSCALRAHVLACLCATWRVLRWGYRSFLRGAVPAACRPTVGSVRAIRAPACGLSPAAAFQAIGRPFPPVPDENKCLLLSGALPPLTPARVAPAGGRCFSWYLSGFWPCAVNFAPVKFSRSSDKGATAKPLDR